MSGHSSRWNLSVRVLAWAAAAALPGLRICPPAGASPQAAPEICINEVLFDPAGPDEGHEFVELYNRGLVTLSLQGWRIEAGNGDRPGDWRLQWTGSSADRVAPGDFFLIAGSLRPEPADARANLSLQNGPDAVRLRSPEGWCDVVGWGEHLHAEYFESRPASDVPGGWVLARIPDGEDRDCNSTDLVARAHATPGTTNQPAWSAALSDLRCEPPVLDARGTGRLSITVTNLGTRELDLAALDCRATSGVLEAIATPAGPHLAVDQSRECVWELVPRATAAIETLTVVLSGPAGEQLEAQIALRVGRGAILISEIQYDPVADEGEWVELLNTAESALDVSGWAMSDASGQVTLLGPGAVTVASGAWLVIAQDPAALREAHPELEPEVIAPRQGSWPSLNNSVDSERGYADRVVLADASGVACDCVSYTPGDLDGDGVSLERWIEGRELREPLLLVPCPAAAGATPGTSSWPIPRGAEGSLWYEPRPRPFFPDREGEERFCRVLLPALTGAVTADVFSLAGIRVATLIAGARVQGPLALVWDGRDSSGSPLPTGLYVLRLAGRPQGAAQSRALLRTVALVRG